MIRLRYSNHCANPLPDSLQAAVLFPVVVAPPPQGPEPAGEGAGLADVAGDVEDVSDAGPEAGHTSGSEVDGDPISTRRCGRAPLTRAAGLQCHG